MPTNFSSIPGNNQKKLKLLALLVLSPLLFHAQTLTGLWIGTLSNDSTTIRKDQSFEIALTEYKGKVYGYSRSEFIVDDVLYFVVKRVKGTIEGDICEVEDEEIIAYNFRGKLDKKVKVTSIFRRNRNDSSWYLDGTWKTNQTKNYYSVTGKVTLEEEKDLTASKIFPHLEELKLANDVAFYKERTEGAPIVRIARPEKVYENSVASKNQISTVDEKNQSQPNLSGAHSPAIPAVVTTIVSSEPMPEPIQANTVAKEETKKPFLNAGSKTNLSNTINIAPDATPAIVKNKPETIQPSVSGNSDHVESKNQPTLIASTNALNRDAGVDAKKTATNSVTDNSTVKTIPETKKDVVVVQDNSKNQSLTNPVNSLDSKSNTVSPKTDPDKNTVSVQNKSTQANSIASNKPAAKNNTSTPVTSHVAEKSTNTPVKTDPNKNAVVIQNNSATQKPPATNTEIVKNNPTATTTTNNKNQPVVKAAESKSTPVIAVENRIEKQEIKIEPVVAPVIPLVKSTVAERNGAAGSINDRKTEISQVVHFKSDSLQIALYDNGQIDGDTVSLLMNGEVILAKQGLKASAIRKTIFLSGKEEEFNLVLYAENLGELPPNTGLLVVRDGDDVYNLRFSSDFQKNTGIVFRRKK